MNRFLRAWWRSLGAVIFLGCLSLSCNTRAFETPLKKIPDFSLPELKSGNTVTLSSVNRDSPVLVVFWASWCPNCVDEIPALNRVQESFSSRGLKLLAVNVEESKETILKFQKKHPMNYPVLLDQEGETAEKFGLVGIPAAVLAEKGGNVLYFGFSVPENLEKLIQLNEKGSA